jgi:hypothetical protein
VVDVALRVEIDRDGAASKLLRRRNVVAVEVILRDFFAVDFDLDSQLRHVPFSRMQANRIRRFERSAGRTHPII